MAKVREEKFIKAFAKRVRELRQERGLTMEALAELCGVDYRQIARIESGQVNTSISMAHRLAKSLGVTLAELFEGM